MQRTFNYCTMNIELYKNCSNNVTTDLVAKSRIVLRSMLKNLEREKDLEFNGQKLK